MSFDYSFLEYTRAHFAIILLFTVTCGSAHDEDTVHLEEAHLQ